MMKLPLFFSVIGALVSISAAAEVATPKSASPEERLKLATPRLPQHETVEESTSKENTLSITKEELVKRPDLIIRGLSLRCCKIMWTRWHCCFRYIGSNNRRNKIRFCWPGGKL